MTKKTEQEFLSAYSQYAKAIYRHCFFRVYNKTRAEDFTQETFTRVWQYLAQGKHIENLRAFLYRVANNLIIDFSRKKKEESLEALIELSPANEPGYPGHQQITDKILYDEVVDGMSHLAPDYKEILTLRYVNGMQPREVAQLMHSNSNNISVKINRGVKALRSQFVSMAQMPTSHTI